MGLFLESGESYGQPKSFTTEHTESTEILFLFFSVRSVFFVVNETFDNVILQKIFPLKKFMYMRCHWREHFTHNGLHFGRRIAPSAELKIFWRVRPEDEGA